MILDSQNRFSPTPQSAVIGAPGDIVSTDVYNTQIPAQGDVGIGEDLHLFCRTVAAVVGVGASVQFVLQTDDNVAFSSPRDFPLTAAIPVAQLTANTVQYRGKLPLGLEQFIRIVYRVSGAATTAGTVDSFLVKDTQATPFSPSAYNVTTP